METELNIKPFGKDGTAVSGWFVLDYGTHRIPSFFQKFLTMVPFAVFLQDQSSRM